MSLILQQMLLSMFLIIYCKLIFVMGHPLYWGIRGLLFELSDGKGKRVLDVLPQSVFVVWG